MIIWKRFLLALGVLFVFLSLNSRSGESSQRALPIPFNRELNKQIKYILGGVENVTLVFSDRTIVTKARVDTGATTSSLSATNIRLFKNKQNPKGVVLFTFHDEWGNRHDVSLPLARQGSVRSASNRRSKRHFVRGKVCVAGHLLEGEFSLHDRRHMNFPVLIGRNHLSGRFMVDVDRPPTLEYNNSCL